MMGGGMDGWSVFDGLAEPRAGGGGGGRGPGGGAPAFRGGPLDGVPLGDGGARGRAARGQADGRRPAVGDPGRGRGGAAAHAGGERQPSDPGGVPRPAGGGAGRPSASLDGGPGAAADGLDVKEAEPARGRAGPR